MMLTGVAPAFSVTCPIVCGFTGSLNWIVTRPLIGTCVTPFPGVTAVTHGAVVLGAKPEVNEEEVPQPRLFPPRSVRLPQPAIILYGRPVANSAAGARNVFRPSELCE